MNKDKKMDLHGARTAADIERKYNFGKSFAEVMGIANDARTLAEQSGASAEELDKKLDQEEIFNRLTNNGTAQGIFRGDDGKIYINADYIVALSKLFAKDIIMTGTFTNTIEAFIEPGLTELQTLQQHILGSITIPKDLLPDYDFSGDGRLSSKDLLMGQKAMMGLYSLASWSGARKTPVTLTIDLKNPDKAIQISGTNMWGRDISGYIGINGTSFLHRGTADFVTDQGEANGWLYQKWNSGIFEMDKRVTIGTCEDIRMIHTYEELPFAPTKKPIVDMTLENAEFGGLLTQQNAVLSYTTTVNSPSVKFCFIRHEGGLTDGDNVVVSVKIKGYWK